MTQIGLTASLLSPKLDGIAGGKVDWSALWNEVDLFPSPNLPTVVVAFAVAFLLCLATVITLATIDIHRTGRPPWDSVQRDTARRRFCMYIVLVIFLAISCGIIGVGIAIVPILPIIAAGVAPRIALNSLSGGTPDLGNAPRGEKNDESKR